MIDVNDPLIMDLRMNFECIISLAVDFKIDRDCSYHCHCRSLPGAHGGQRSQSNKEYSSIKGAGVVEVFAVVFT